MISFHAQRMVRSLEKESIVISRDGSLLALVRYCYDFRPFHNGKKTALKAIKKVVLVIYLGGKCDGNLYNYV